MKTRTIIYPNKSSAISSITIYPQDKLMGIEYTSGCKAYTYSIVDLSIIYDLLDAQVFGESFGKLINSSIKSNRLAIVK